MKPAKEIYDKILPFTIENQKGFMIPGAYCQACGKTFAVYPYSMIKPSHIDDQNKAYYIGCGLCDK